MPDAKKLVIKINYANKNVDYSPDPGSAMRSEWNFKRIGVALAILFAVIAIGVYLAFFLGGSEPQTSPPAGQAWVEPQQEKQARPASEAEVASESTATQEPISAASEARPSPNKSATTTPTGKVVRAQLATAVNHKEPSGSVGSTLHLRKNERRVIYYFTELQDMTGTQVYHEWLYQGTSIFKRPIRITTKQWRTATHKTIRSDAPGNWTVRLTDAQGKVLHQLEFTVVIDNK